MPENYVQISSKWLTSTAKGLICLFQNTNAIYGYFNAIQNESCLPKHRSQIALFIKALSTLLPDFSLKVELKSIALK